MQTYLVGGFVRDQLLGRPAHERDWVVVGATPEMLLAQGFQPVGKSFPVFLHPKTHEEYALARTERKTGTGHTAFSCDANPNITLEEDLARRDLTINAIALTPTQQLIDPYHGQADLTARVLRHVSNAFVEDPLRVLRVARFAAQLAPWNFTVAPETLALMREISKSGELQTLSHERVWQEVEKALQSTAPERFFNTLAECEALTIFFPPLQAGFATLTVAAELTQDPCIRYAALLFAHQSKLPTPKRYDELAKLVHQYHEGLRNPAALSVDARLTLLQKTDALRRTERFQQALIACQAIQQVHCPQTPFPLAYWQEALSALKAIDIQPLLQQGLKGHPLREGIEALQRQVLAHTPYQ